ncbi:MAG: hypothetical protein K8F24_02545 [Bacteroidales bacterium]|nr:hypothetical protein [Bacteroidales bacterium]
MIYIFTRDVSDVSDLSDVSDVSDFSEVSELSEGLRRGYCTLCVLGDQCKYDVPFLKRR